MLLATISKAHSYTDGIHKSVSKHIGLGDPVYSVEKLYVSLVICIGKDAFWKVKVEYNCTFCIN